jgi:hypothetical protein
MDRTLAKDLGRRVVGAVAPDELPVFESKADAYLDDPRRARSAQSADGGRLSADIGTTLLTLTPVVMYLISVILNLVTEWSLISGLKWLRRLLGRRRGSAKPGTETAEQKLAATRAKLDEHLRAKGIDLVTFLRQSLEADRWPPQLAAHTAEVVAPALAVALSGSAAQQDPPHERDRTGD